MPSLPTGSQPMYDILLLGLTYLRQERPDVLARRANSIYRALREARVIGEGQRLSVAKNVSLISMAISHAETMRGDRKPPKRKIVERCGISDMHLLLLMPNRPLQYEFVLGPQGNYLLVVTEAGMAYAHSVAAQYSELLTPDKFMDGWRSFVKHAQATAMRRGAAAGPAGAVSQSGSGDGEQKVTISREALYTEDDFEW